MHAQQPKLRLTQMWMYCHQVDTCDNEAVRQLPLKLSYTVNQDRFSYAVKWQVDYLEQEWWKEFIVTY